MRFSLVSPTLLCVLTWMSSVHASQGLGTCLCIGWSTTKIPLTNILNYTVQSEGACPIAAVVFQTKGEKRICSDPNSKWAKRAMAKVDEEAKGTLETEPSKEMLKMEPTNEMLKMEPTNEMLKMEPTKEMIKMEPNEQRSTSDIATTVSTTSKKAPGKKVRRRSRRQRKKSGRGRKRQRACT